MKTLLGKLRHGVTDAPGIPIAEVRTAFFLIKPYIILYASLLPARSIRNILLAAQR